MLLLLPVLILSQFIGLGQQQLTTCNVRQNPFSYSTPTTGQALGATFYIDLNNPFTCYGVITKWRLCYKRSAGALSDTIKIGVYRSNNNGESYVRKGHNSIYLQLQHSDCLNITADPQIVVQAGDVLAFYASLAYIKFYDNTTNGYLYKSVAFPSSISSGVLIKTSNPYAPKIGGYIETINPSTPTTTTHSATTSSINTSTTAVASSTPSPTSESGIPPPDLLSNECLVGVNEAFVHKFQETSTDAFLSHRLPSLCSGVIERWELCYKQINDTANIQIGVWRQNSINTQYTLIGSEEATLISKHIHFINPLVCSTVTSTNNLTIEEGDLIGFNTSNISMAFANSNIMKRSNTVTNNTLIPLLRAIVRIRTTYSTNLPLSTSLSYTLTLSPLPPTLAPANSNWRNIGISLGVVASILMTVLVTLLLVMYVLINKRKADNARTNLIGNQPNSERNDMMYNVQYVPQNPVEIIISNRRESLGFKKNPSYTSSTDLGELPMPPPSNKLEHIYESI